MTFTPWITKEIKVTSWDQLAWTIDSTALYIIDWVVDMWTDTIKVPTTWINIRGLGFWVSKLISSANSYSMFVNDWVNYTWDVFLDRIDLEVTWTGSQLYNLDNQGNWWAIEHTVVNFNNCTSLGNLSNYRQWLELNTWRFWGTPTLTFNWTWAWGYRVTTSITRWLSAWMTGSLFQEWTWLTFSSRFLTDMNCDLPTNASFANFQSSNFTAPSLFQISWAIISRNFVIDANDTNILPNITSSDLSVSFRNNQWITNTYVGWESLVTAETTTVITTPWTFVFLDWTYTASNLQHFDAPANWQLRHLGNNPREYRFIWDLNVDGWSNDSVSVRVRKWDNSASQFETVQTQTRQVNSFVWGRDVAFFTIITNVILDINDYVFLEVANNSWTTNVTLENWSFFILQER